MSITSILNPDADVKLSSGETVTVKELAWKKALVFFEKLEGQVKGMLDAEGKFKFDTATIFTAIRGNAPLVEWIAIECTGKDNAWLETISLGDMAKIVTKALEINLRSVAEEIKNVKGRLDALALAGGAHEQSSK
jgi:hypothetical protein